MLWFVITFAVVRVSLGKMVQKQKSYGNKNDSQSGVLGRLT